MYEALVARLRESRETPIVHVERAWNIGLLLLNELTRDGIEPRVESKDRWILGRQFATPQNAPRPLHVYTQTSAHGLAIANCLERLVQSSNIDLFVSKVEVISCKPPLPAAAPSP